MRERFGLVLWVLWVPLSPASFNETDSWICSLGTEDIVWRALSFFSSSGSLRAVGRGGVTALYPLLHNLKKRGVYVCVRARVCPHETRPGGLSAYFSENSEICDSTPVLCLHVVWEGPKGKEKNRKTAPLCSMSMLENPAKTSLAVFWNKAAGPSCIRWPTGGDLADLRIAIN